MALEPVLQVVVAYSPAPGDVIEIPVPLPSGAKVLDALQHSGLPARFPDLDWATASLGVWGRKATLNQLLRDHDRVEIYRALQVDPKVARRQRFAKQGARTTGLFAKQRIGGKAGY